MALGAPFRCWELGDFLQIDLRNSEYDQLGNTISSPQLNRLSAVEVDRDNLDLTPVTRVHEPRRVHDAEPVRQRTPRPRLHEARVSVRDRESDTSTYLCPFTRVQLYILGRKEIEASVTRTGVGRQRQAGVKTANRNFHRVCPRG